MIAVIGDLLLDVFLLSGLQESEQEAGIVTRPGGSAANTAAWLAALGHSCVFIGCVGSDAVGGMLVEDLRARGVTVGIRVCPGRETGAVAVDVGNGGERIMRSSRGANMELSPDDLHLIGGERPALIHLTGYSLLGRYGMRLLSAVAHLAHTSGARFSFDPSSPGVIEKVGRVQLLAAIRDSGVDILLPNLEEAKTISQKVNTLDAALALSEYAPVVVVKTGDEGCVVHANGETLVCETTSIRPVDTTGAGDAFNAAFLDALCGGAAPRDACKRANEISVRVLRQYGGRPSMPVSPQTAPAGKKDLEQF